MPTDTLDWTFNGSWPHPPQWFDTPDGRMHFVDVGPRGGRPVVLVHGNPTWGYLFRHFIPPIVQAGLRVIVPDHLGFGRSDKPRAGAVYAVERHARRLAALLDALDLRNATVAGHDWGGTVGFYWAARNADRVRSLVVLQAFVHPPAAPIALPLPLRLFRVPVLGQLAVQGLSAIVRGFLFGAGVRRRDRLTATVRRAYRAPHRGWSARAGMLAFARAFPDGPGGAVAALQADIHAGLTALRARPMFIAWADHDAILTAATLARWQRDFPHAEVLRLPDSGHFLQEDAHELVVPALVRFLGRA